MPITRQSIVRGPGTVTYNSVRIFDRDGITAELDSATQEIGSSISGKLDTIKTDQVGKVTLTPVGNLSQELLDVLFPAWLRTPVIGRSVFGAADVPLAVSSRAGRRVTFLNAALTKCPELLLSPVKTAFGPVEFTALVANGKLATDADSLYAEAAADYADGEPPRTGLSGFHYVGQLGDLAIPDTVDGWTVSVEPQLNPVGTDSQGTVDYTLGGVNVTAKCRPIGLSEDQVLGALPVLRGRGASMAGESDLVIRSAGGLVVTLRKATAVTGPLQWGSTQLRAGELGFTAHVDTEDGSLFTVELDA
ncbi:MAG: hypothetical protein ACI4RD_02925 [Kiritimatiellia bacterium]